MRADCNRKSPRRVERVRLGAPYPAVLRVIVPVFCNISSGSSQRPEPSVEPRVRAAGAPVAPATIQPGNESDGIDQSTWRRHDR
jgi:hypothetical protein